MIKYTNVTNVKEFMIIGFPELPPEYYGMVSFFLFLVFTAILFGNVFILAVIICEHNLHKPTYVIFFNLAMTDLLFGTVTLPKIIARYWWNDMMCSFGACFAQMYFVHSLGVIQSLILLMMALDRFVAIRFPFRYVVLFTNKNISISCGLCWVLTFILMMGIVLHALTLPYCDRNTIRQCYCDHNSITNLGCGDDVAYVKWVAFANAMVTLLAPLIFIIISYFSIIMAVRKMSVPERHHKVLSTCAPQIFITCLYFVPRCIVYLTDSLGIKFSLNARIIITMMYSLIPPAINPVIYCLKTMEIKTALTQRFSNRKINLAPQSDKTQNVKSFA
ncbi:olfactory receptor 52B2-like [Girardinichthys multiradiatus]|uniref:olfactory receptor 52B2-like n=1 Tax=Girardinichthys multiradiatus TaxID=208333 RepID=UPI001FAE5E44|nr:olfactory receptor 52B2-like [Girardinichthys multiradiatus]